MTIRLGRVSHYGSTRSIARFESYYRFSLGNPRANNKILFVSPFPTYPKKLPLPKIFFSTSEKHISFICVISPKRMFLVKKTTSHFACRISLKKTQRTMSNINMWHGCINVKKLICMCFVHVDVPPVRTVEYFYSLNLEYLLTLYV